MFQKQNTINMLRNIIEYLLGNEKYMYINNIQQVCTKNYKTGTRVLGPLQYLTPVFPRT